MAYADFDFYTTGFHGDVLTEQNAGKWLERASDEIDTVTFHRLTTGFPTEEYHVARVKKAVCAVAEALFFVDEQRQAVSATKDAQGRYRNAVASISSGRESVSYAQTSGNSVYAKAVADQTELMKLVKDIAVRYLANVPDANGTNLLYAGVV